VAGEEDLAFSKTEEATGVVDIDNRGLLFGRVAGLITSKVGLSLSHTSKLATLGAAEPLRIFPVFLSKTGTGVSSAKLAGLDAPSDEMDFLS
jgi:hypothetical protein